MEAAQLTTVARAQLTRRRTVRQVAAALAAGCAAAYLAIGFGVVNPERGAAEASALHALGISLCAAYVTGAVLLLGLDRRGFWIVGAFLQALLIVAYVATGGNRVPSYEPWGVLLGTAQLALLASLLYLIVSAGGRCECMYCRHHRRVHRGRCLVVACPCDVFV